MAQLKCTAEGLAEHLQLGELNIVGRWNQMTQMTTSEKKTRCLESI